jgi:Family of unknown function (DUF6295)
MCTMIVNQAKIWGRGKGATGWFTLGEVNVSYDHPFDAPLEHALNLDFVNEAEGPGARVAVELSVDSARQLVQAILATLERAEAGGYLGATEGTATTGE